MISCQSKLNFNILVTKRKINFFIGTSNKIFPFEKKRCSNFTLCINSCSSYVGQTGRPQPITLASGCWTPGIVDHEIGKQGVNPGSSLI